MTRSSLDSGYRDLEELRVRLAEFRSANRPRTPLPEELWRAAAEIAAQRGMKITPRVLRPDRNSLTKWMEKREFSVSVCKAPESGFFLSQYAADGGSADIQSSGDLRFADSLAEQLSYFGSSDRRRGGTGAALPGMVQSRPNTVVQDVVFEGGKH